MKKILYLFIIISLTNCSLIDTSFENEKDKENQPDNLAPKPAIIITYPENGTTLNSDFTILTDTSDDTVISKAEFYINDTLINTVITPPFAHNACISDMPEGSYKLSVKAYNSAGDTASSTVDITIQQNKASPAYPVRYTGTILTGTKVKLYSATKESTLKYAVSSDLSLLSPPGWTIEDTINFDTEGKFKVFTRTTKDGMEDSVIKTFYIQVVSSFSSAADETESNAVHMDSPDIWTWVVNHTSYNPGPGCDAIWQNPENAYGKASGTSTDIVCLGDGGDITLAFDKVITNDEGADFAVFENSFSDTFLELAFVEVSSNGIDYTRFNSFSLTESPVESWGEIEPTKIYNLAGKYRQGYGTPFDLEDLRFNPNVISGKVDLQKINFIRIIDITGDGREKDKDGNPIYDPYPTSQSAGFDLDGVAVINYKK